MKLMRTEEAVGQVLCHDITRIIKDVVKDARFRKGHVIREEDVAVLLDMGKDNVYIWENDGSMLHEDDAAELLRGLCQGEYMRATAPKEGKIELIAEIDGLLMVDTERLRRVNSLGEIIIATRVTGFTVKAGEKLCGTRVVPLLIEKEKLDEAYRVAGGEPLMRLLPIGAKKYGLITTGNEVYHRRIRDDFTPVIQGKMEEYGSRMCSHEVLSDDHRQITEAINRMLEAGADMVLCTGGMSVDPDDRTPLAIKNSGAAIVAYGAPVLPGSMFMIAYTADGRPICGLPGCVMYHKRTIFDLALPLLLADVPITAEWLAGLGHGGLCMNCTDCHFPNCMFGKGV